MSEQQPQLHKLQEGRTHRDKDGMRIVYHLNDQSEWKEVMKKQKTGLWVSPNLGQDLNWGGWIAGGSKRNVFYLHKLAIPEWMYEELMEFERGQTRTATDPLRQNEQTPNVTELVIPPQYWKFVQPVGIKKYLRSELLRQSNSQRRLEADIDNRKQFRNPTKKYGIEVQTDGRPFPGYEQEEYERRKRGNYKGFDD